MKSVCVAVALMLVACGGDSAGDGDSEVDAGPADVGTIPFSGEIAPLAAGEEVDELDHFPLNAGGVWRYRRKASDGLNPPPLTQGAEVTLEAGEEEGEVVRQTITLIDVDVDGEMKSVRQVFRETYVYTEDMGAVGPRVLVKRLDVEERVNAVAAADRKLVRTISRVYDPPYKLFSDSWKTGLIDNEVRSNTTRMVEEILLPGDEEPRRSEGLVSLVIKSSASTEIIPMEGQYREDIHEVNVFDDFLGTEARTYWVTPGVGLVQWRFRDTNNITWTLFDTNLE